MVAVDIGASVVGSYRAKLDEPRLVVKGLVQWLEQRTGEGSATEEWEWRQGSLRRTCGGGRVLAAAPIDWDAMLLKLVKWLGLIGCFGHATYTAANWQSTQPLTELEVLRQFSPMRNGQTIVDTMAFAASLSGSSSQSSSSDEVASKKSKTTGTYKLNTV